MYFERARRRHDRGRVTLQHDRRPGDRLAHGQTAAVVDDRTTRLETLRAAKGDVVDAQPVGGAAGPPDVALPDGLAVMFSLPMGSGFTPAISQFETAHPMATSEDSNMETSMSSPSPVRPRRTSAAAMAKAAVMPPMVSATG